VNLTPEQREALEAFLNAGDLTDEEMALFELGMRYAYEDAAKVCEQQLDVHKVPSNFICAKAIRSRIPKESAP